MGKYVSTTSLSILLPRFLKTNTTTGDVEGIDIWQRHVLRAEAIVDGAISSRYNPTVFISTPPMIIQLVEDIASYFTLRNSLTQDGKEKNQYLDDYLDQAKDQLQEIQDGDLQLTYTDGSSVAPLTAGRFIINTSNYTPIYDLDDPEVWKVDSDKINDMSDARASG